MTRILSKEQLQRYIALSDEVRVVAKEVLVEYHRIRNEILGEAPNPYLDFDKLEGDTIEYEGDEYWSFGGYEHHQMSLPASLLVGEGWGEVIALANEERKRRDDLKAARVEQDKLSRQKLFEELKAEFD